VAEVSELHVLVESEEEEFEVEETEDGEIKETQDKREVDAPDKVHDLKEKVEDKRGYEEEHGYFNAMDRTLGGCGKCLVWVEGNKVEASREVWLEF
jgi:hypothetical protein